MKPLFPLQIPDINSTLHETDEMITEVVIGL